MALAAMFLFAGQANAIADNPVDACNGSNHYSDGHSCAFQQSQGIAAYSFASPTDVVASLDMMKS
ncbi:uncharacterized protein ARMOST_03946 [Armillaria ostoyae]|uniref:CBM1 domain-containing protein n=1 Tax=Armillaria ostoyae TaxID=47428 RepID=A0A284QW13_ARMOS|nr:uncharacterized protein ARMOST_03946 [Armillaria ostoyae]